jgi:cell division protein FtsX
VVAGACSSSGTSASSASSKGSREFIVFMQLHATAPQAGVVRRHLTASHRVDRVAFISKQAAYRSFRRFVGRDRPELVATITSADLPASFDVVARTRRDVHQLERRLRRLPGVDGYQTPPDPKQLREWCASAARGTSVPSPAVNRWCRSDR